MTIRQRLNLLWRRFSPLEDQLLAAVRGVLPPQTQPTFDAQVAGITLVQRHPHWIVISFYRRSRGKVDWTDIPAFPRTGEFPLAEVRFSARGRQYKAKLTCIGGHIFDFAVTPGPKAVAFEVWDTLPSARLLADPLLADTGRVPEPIPEVWIEFLARRHGGRDDDWVFHNADTAYSIALDNGQFVVLAERAGEEFVMHRVEPPGPGLFYSASHDALPEPLEGELDAVFEGK